MMINIAGTLFAAIQQYIPAQAAAIISACLTAVFTGFNAWIKVNNPESSEIVIPRPDIIPQDK
jgi:hypothetical protein